MLNQAILFTFNDLAKSGPVLADIAVFFAEWFPYLLVFLAAFYALRLRATHGLVRSFLLIFLPPFVAWFFADIFKSLFQATRPFAELSLIPLVGGEDPLASFPSAHATFFSALGMMIFLHDKKMGTWFLAGAVAIGLARIAVGVHWPSDILAGFLLGGLVAFVANLLWQKFSNKFPVEIGKAERGE